MRFSIKKMMPDIRNIICINQMIFIFEHVLEGYLFEKARLRISRRVYRLGVGDELMNSLPKFLLDFDLINEKVVI
ncbi:hypothetical protein [Clostridium sp.]|uniref:hypothetical protein n=1 Tax=Clostridium sp. TaxID=1506 RepID=UPI003216E34A